MTEAQEIAATMIADVVPGSLKTHDDAVAWIKDEWPGISKTLGRQMLDNVAEALKAMHDRRLEVAKV